MITELKIKKRKFGTIISSLVDGFNSPEDAVNLESMNAYSAFVTIHTTHKSGEVANGVNYYKQKVGPKLKQAIGHHIAQIRGDQVLAMTLPTTILLEDMTRVYAFAEGNRMERAYGFFLGDPENPSLVALSGPIVPHLFHAIPDQMDMIGTEWLKWIHTWAPRAMMSHRYFDANQYCAMATRKAQEVKPAENYPIVDASIPEAYTPPAPESLVSAHITSEMPAEAKETAKAEVLKRKPGRPKKK